MITYKELSSLENDLGYDAKILYGVSNHISSHYRKVILPKHKGGSRTLYVPDKLLKSIQRQIAQRLLSMEEISPFATAYRVGGSTLRNAAPHAGMPMLLKLDIKNFFDHITYPMVKHKVFPAEKYSESNRILLSLLCIYKDALPQGAPTSPWISNIIMKDFDDVVGQWCCARGIIYTRYCDDMSFSGEIDKRELVDLVTLELRKHGFFLNKKKTVFVKQGQRMNVTGVVVNSAPNIPADYRRALRQELYFCQKFGVEDHLAKIGAEISAKDYVKSLLGKVCYALFISPNDKDLNHYKTVLMQMIKKLG